jgi:hypothetical protein
MMIIFHYLAEKEHHDIQMKEEGVVHRAFIKKSKSSFLSIDTIKTIYTTRDSD